MDNKSNIFIIGSVLLALVINVDLGLADTEGKIQIQNIDKLENVTYTFYAPKAKTSAALPLLVFVGGLNSSSKEFLNEKWKKFAQENNLAMLCLGFKFVEEDWKRKRSYQYPQAWSGKALFAAMKELSKTENINSKELYLFGVSAGAQFAHRFALLNPDICKAVAIHSAGGYDYPKKWIPAKFFVTVGELDNDKISRLEFAKLFVKACENQKIDVRLKIFPGVGHTQIEEQDELSRQFFKEVKQSQK